MSLKMRRGRLLWAVVALLGGGIVMALSSGSEFGFWQTLGQFSGTRQDLGPIDFAALTRRSTPNDALACLPEICPQARADVAPPLFTIPAADLREKLRTSLRDESRLTELAAVDDLHLRFVQRSLLMRFPDIIDVVIVPRSSGVSTLALYSRSAVGRSDLGVNRARIERWLAYIGL
jgi:uncharacterized protein (DUF1499 family)